MDDNTQTITLDPSLESYQGQRFQWFGHPRTPELIVTEIRGVGALADVVLRSDDGEIKREISETTFRIEMRNQLLLPVEPLTVEDAGLVEFIDPDPAATDAAHDAAYVEYVAGVDEIERSTDENPKPVIPSRPPVSGSIFDQAREWLAMIHPYPSLKERNDHGVELSRAIAQEIGFEVALPGGLTGANLTNRIAEALRDLIDPKPGKDPVTDATVDEILAAEAVDGEGAQRFAEAVESYLTEAERANHVLNPMPLDRECASHGPWTFDGTPEGSECPGCAKAWLEERAAYEARVAGEVCSGDMPGHTQGAPVIECPGCQESKASIDAFFKAQGHVPQPTLAPKQKRGRKGSEATKTATPEPGPAREPETFEELRAARDRAREEVNRYEAKMREMFEAERARKLAELEEFDRMGSELGLSA